MTNSKRNIVVLGAGESGVGAALLAQKAGFDVFVSDRGRIDSRHAATLQQAGISFESGQHSLDRIMKADEVVKSPGIPDHIALVQDLLAKEIPVISEIEWASRYTNATIIGLTGTNGKTTTTKLLTKILQTAGFDVKMLGNVGYSFARSLAEGADHDIYVVELSSFQLDGIRAFRPDIAMILNITPDHLDRYEYKMDNYVASKFRITENQTAEDYFLYNSDSAAIASKVERMSFKARSLAISSAMMKEDGVLVDGQFFKLQGTALIGKHNYMNALFAIKTALILRANPQLIRKGLDAFESVPHRLEKITTCGEVTYYNDSKATNVEATYFALEAMTTKLIWIVGGQDKGNDYELLQPLVKDKVVQMIGLGLDNEKIKSAFSNTNIPIIEVKSATEAVREAMAVAKPGMSVLLSPACASFDLFKNYEDRGDQFRNAVLELTSKKEDKDYELSR